MHEEFKKLIEAMVLGDLDEPGRERLRELASADPAVAERLREEQAIEAMLAGLGPNHAPMGLAAKVFERLDTEPALSAADISLAIQRTFARRRTGFPWIPMTCLRWASALAVLGIVVFEVSILVMQNRRDGQALRGGIALSTGGGVHTTPAAQLFYEDLPGDAGQAPDQPGRIATQGPDSAGPDRQLAMGLARDTTPLAPSGGETPETEPSPMGMPIAPEDVALRGAIENEAGRQDGQTGENGEDGKLIQGGIEADGDVDLFVAAPVPQGARAKTDSPVPTPDVPEKKTATDLEPETGTGEPAAPERMLAAGESLASQGADAPESGDEAADAKEKPASERVLERRVALRIPLAAANGTVARSRTTGVNGGDIGGLLKGLNGTESQGPVKRSLVEGGIVRTPTADAPGQAVSLRDLEMAVAVAGGDIVARERLAGPGEAWKITARMTPAALRTFLEKYSTSPPTDVDRDSKPNEFKDEGRMDDRLFAHTVVDGRNLLWALGFQGRVAAGDGKTTASPESFVPLDERPKPRPDLKIEVILLLGGSGASPSAGP